MLRRPLVLIAALVGLATGASAQPTDRPVENPSRATDLHDLLRRLQHKPPVPDDAQLEDADYRRPVWLRVPFVASSPSTGPVAGAGLEATFFRGRPPATHASTLQASVAFTAKRQLLSALRFNFYSNDDTWLFAGDNKLEHTSMDIHGLGSNASEDAAANVGYHLVRLHNTTYRRVYRDLYAGVGLHVVGHTSVMPNGSLPGWLRSDYVAYSSGNGLGPESQRSAGTSLEALFDSRDSSVSPSRGWFLNGSYRMFFDGLLGGTSSWQELYVEARAYRSLARSARHRIAVWAYGDLVTGGTAPYLDLPATGGDPQGRSGRGYVTGRFRGEGLLYAEAEYRVTVTSNGLIGLVGFVNATTVRSDMLGERLFDSVAPAAGVGLRVMLDKRSRSNICIDLGVGRRGSQGLHVGLQEAF
jgi:hypothetical protein